MNPRVEELIADIQRARNASLSGKINRYHRKNQILSDISDCDRQMVYSILNWEDRPLHTPELQARFDQGNRLESDAIAELRSIGYEVILSQQPITIKARDGNVMATGKIDGSIKWHGVEFPLEIKSMNPNLFTKLESVEDFEKKPWTRKYPRQLQMYMYGKNKEQGFFLILDCLGKWKLFPIYLDYGVCEWILQKLERNYEHIKNKTLPGRIDYKKEICGNCAFKNLCLPDIVNEGFEMVESGELEELVREREKLLPNHRRFEEIDKEAKALARNHGQDFILGTDWKVELKTVSKKMIDTKLIPIFEREKYEVEIPVTKVQFIPLNEAKI